MHGRDRDQENEDSRVQREVLTLLLAKGSTGLDRSELEARPDDPAEVERAVEALTADDLAVRDGDKVVPMPAAIRFNELRSIGRGRTTEG
jgi:hypothetical protein